MDPSNFDVQHFEKKLMNLSNTQDSITGLSKWCIQRRNYHKLIVRSWLNVLKLVKTENRLTLFYLANDVIQHSKRKNYEFVASWGTTLQKATTLVRDDKVKEKISRIFGIWEQREIYSDEFISDLNGLLSISQVKKTASIPIKQPSPIANRVDDNDDEYQVTTVISSIRSCVTMERDTDKNFQIIVKTPVPDMEKTKSNLKDRSNVEDVERDIENTAKKFENFVTTLKAEIKARSILLTALDQAEEFYKNQRRDVKKVVYAYRNFGESIKKMQSDLNERVITLPSPIPSPDINAPSPEPDNDLVLPGEMNYYGSNQDNMGYMNFMQHGSLPFNMNDFNRDSPPLHGNQSIQVINSTSDAPVAPLNDFYNSLIPPKLEGYNPEAPSVFNSYGNNNYTAPPPPPTQHAPISNYNDNQRNYLCPPPPPMPTSNTGYNPSMDYGHHPQQSPLMPPPMPPALDQNADYSWNEMRWNSFKDDSYSIETPVSPPHFERKGHENDMIEYIDESLRDMSNSGDIDHRQMPEQSQLKMNKDLARVADIDHRNLISLTGSPGQSTKPKDWSEDIDYRSAQGNNQSNNVNNGFLLESPLSSILEPPPPMEKFGQFFNMVDQMDSSKSGPSFSTPLRNSRPPLLPTPNLPPRYNRNNSMNSESSMNSRSNNMSNRPDDVESVDMEMSDDDANGMDERGNSGDNFYNNNQSNLFPLPHQINMNRPPPLLPDSELANLQHQQQHKTWNSNGNGNHNLSQDDGNGSMEEPMWNNEPPTPPNVIGMAPNFMQPGHRPFDNNFRGNGRGGRGNRGSNNSSPYFRGGRGGGGGGGGDYVGGGPNGPKRGRGGYRGNFRGQW